MPPKTKLEKEATLRKLIQSNIAFMSRVDLCTVLDMNEKSLQMWELESMDKFPIESYFLVAGQFKSLIYPTVSVLEYVSGTERAMRIMEEEGKLASE